MTEINVPSKTIQIYNWFDIQKEICRVMGIPEDKFRKYHDIVGGEYKDLWHVCLDAIIPDQMHNDTIVRLYNFDEPVSELNLGSEDQYGLMYFVRNWGEWVVPFLEAYQEVMNVLTNGDYDAPVHVEFSCCLLYTSDAADE